MDAIILAAGKGVRLQPYTLNTPKPLLEVQGRPILDHILTSLPQSVERLIVVVHYLAEQIENYLRHQTHYKHWYAVHQNEARGTGDALRCCQKFVQSDRILVLNGDDLYSREDLEKLAQCDAGLLVKTVMDPAKWGIVFPKPDGTLQSLIEKPKDLQGPQLANIGAYLFPRTVFQYELQLSPRGEYEITDYVSHLAKEHTVHLIPTAFWYPIGNVEAWRSAQHLPLPKTQPRKPTN